MRFAGWRCGVCRHHASRSSSATERGNGKVLAPPKICWHPPDFFDLFFGISRSLLATYRMAPAVGFEPTTNRLTVDRSTTELRWNLKNNGSVFLADIAAVASSFAKKNAVLCGCAVLRAFAAFEMFEKIAVSETWTELLTQSKASCFLSFSIKQQRSIIRQLRLALRANRRHVICHFFSPKITQQFSFFDFFKCPKSSSKPMAAR